VEPGPLGNPEAPVLLRRALELMETTGVSFPEFIRCSGLPEADGRTLLNRDISERPRVEFEVCNLQRSADDLDVSGSEGQYYLPRVSGTASYLPIRKMLLVVDTTA
jgi:hypothetical protein